MEATLPKEGELDSVANTIPSGTEIFLSTLPHVSLDQQIDTARTVYGKGLNPVLHIAARYYGSKTELAGYLTRASREAQADGFLVIGGDLDTPRGPFQSALGLIQSGYLEDAGAKRLYLAAYPDGHPKIKDEVLKESLDQKIDAGLRRGFSVEVVTQFGFDAAPIVTWLKIFQADWPDIPVKIGVAGPAGLNAILRYAMRCGVQAPKSSLKQKFNIARQLVQDYSPDGLIGELDKHIYSEGITQALSAHLFSFGGVERTAKWAVKDLI